MTFSKRFTILTILFLTKSAGAGLIDPERDSASLQISPFSVARQIAGESREIPRTEAVYLVHPNVALGAYYESATPAYGQQGTRRNSVGARAYWFLDREAFRGGHALDFTVERGDDATHTEEFADGSSDSPVVARGFRNIHGGAAVHWTRYWTIPFGRAVHPGISAIGSVSGGISYNWNTDCKHDPECTMEGGEGPSLTVVREGFQPDIALRVGVVF
ncbi:MAG: hypothetical protein JST04_07225 [Bdellovibrionales bacterium]|nr:hypothetical protein [Bdellovibrionales bacterium]